MVYTIGFRGIKSKYLCFDLFKQDNLGMIQIDNNQMLIDCFEVRYTVKNYFTLCNIILNDYNFIESICNIPIKVVKVDYHRYADLDRCYFDIYFELTNEFLDKMKQKKEDK